MPAMIEIAVFSRTHKIFVAKEKGIFFMFGSSHWDFIIIFIVVVVFFVVSLRFRVGQKLKKKIKINVE